MGFVNEDYVKQLEYENKRLKEKLNAIEKLAHNDDIYMETINKNDYYKNSLEEIIKKCTKRFILIHDHKIYGEYDTCSEAVEDGKKLFKFNNNFIVRENEKSKYSLYINEIEDEFRKMYM